MSVTREVESSCLSVLCAPNSTLISQRKYFKNACKHFSVIWTVLVPMATLSPQQQLKRLYFLLMNNAH